MTASLDPDRELYAAASRIRTGMPAFGDPAYAAAVAGLLEELAGDVLAAAKSGIRVEHNYAQTLAVARIALDVAEVTHA